MTTSTTAPRFSLTDDDFGQLFTAWESNSTTEAAEMLEELSRCEEEATGARAATIREHIRDLAQQIAEA
jgi:hypothetical protein